MTCSKPIYQESWGYRAKDIPGLDSERRTFLAWRSTTVPPSLRRFALMMKAPCGRPPGSSRQIDSADTVQAIVQSIRYGQPPSIGGRRWNEQDGRHGGVAAVRVSLPETQRITSLPEDKLPQGLSPLRSSTLPTLRPCSRSSRVPRRTGHSSRVPPKLGRDACCTSKAGACFVPRSADEGLQPAGQKQDVVPMDRAGQMLDPLAI